ncbi:MAG: O-antigen ligase family protein [Ignavibacteria bacterium]|nr:O-antigen ligase family protein [Ignavibacteria bacterium]
MNYKDKSQIAFYLISAIAASFLLSLVLLQLFIGLLILLWVLEPNSEKKKNFGSVEIYFFAFVCVRVLSICFSEHFKLSIHALYKDALYCVGFFALSFYLHSFSIEKKRRLLEIFLTFSIVVAVIGISKFIFGIKPRAESIVSGYASFSTFLLAGFAIYFSLFADLKKKINPWLLSFGGIIILLALVLALGRADLGIAVAVVILALIQKKISWKFLLPMIAITVVLSYFSFQQNSEEVKVRVNQPATMSDRDILWKSAFQLSGEHPLFGFGPRTFDKIFPNRDSLLDKGVGGWHNDYLTVYLESGIVGLIIFLLLIFQIVKKGYKKFLITDQWQWGVFISIIALLLSAGMSGFINNPILSLLFVFLLALFSSEVEEKI